MLIQYLDKWKYSNAPEGQEPFEKIIGLSKYGLYTSVLVGGYDCIIVSQSYTFWQALNTMSYWVLPITGMCATFASVAYAVTKIRGKDGYANYVLASLATGGVFYHWQKKPILSHNFTVALIACAIAKKHSDFIGEKLFPMDDIFSQHTTIPLDFTIVKDVRGRRPWE
ncbi:uncharacterized protein LOC114944318 [Nylanderia fulva]|uniref:uncharacterized protein LOC114944318 n=1 Tax=Nylanderia fulva TaxID=613905 RepID=UPI0010FB5B40|nr:uncharacterized protein LOC114944318 [Nylanderia fulva]XP_029176038.1 uncharacterized protein LOC114944318 [Nylanderia fulva]XP_029176039.1 uncharacterized protein LOC114944318 [Nylanderia fulva]XP_029176040.1 uncharacterized protein LOC114944318 [Nylanderia fulva]